jgi:hypothetical protein
LTDGTGLVSNYRLADNATTLNAVINPKAISVANTEIEKRSYDGTFDVKVIAGNVSGLIGNETVNLSTKGILDNPNAGNRTAIVSYLLNNPNYDLPDTKHAVTIDQKLLDIAGTTVADKNYDGNNTAKITTGELQGLIGSENLNVAGIGTFDNPEVGNNKLVTAKYTLLDGLNGGLASNYLLENTNHKASILALAPVEPLKPIVPTQPPIPVIPIESVNPVISVPPNSIAEVLPPKDKQVVDSIISYVQSSISTVNPSTSNVAVSPVVAATTKASNSADVKTFSNVTSTPVLSATFGEGTPLALISAPDGEEPSQTVSLSEARQMMTGGKSDTKNNNDRRGANAQVEGDKEVRVPVSRNSLAEIVNGGVKLPGGVEQQLFVVKGN